MSPDHAPLTNAALAEALAIVSRTPALHPPLYICNFDHHASVVQTLVLGPLPAPSAADTFWARERDGVYDYASGALVLRRCGPTADRGGPAEYELTSDTRARLYPNVYLARPQDGSHPHALDVLMRGGWDRTGALATCTCDLYEHGALRLESHAPVPLYHDQWYTTGVEDMRPLRAYDLALALDGDLAARRARIMLHSFDGEEPAEPRVVGVLSPVRPPDAAGSKAAARHADGPGAWFLTVARGVEPDMLVVAVDAWDALVGTADAARNGRREATKKGKKKGGKAKQ